MKIRSLLSVLALAASLLVVGAAQASAKGWGGVDNPDWNASATGVSSKRCAPITSKTLTGTLVGQDGLGVNATIGFDIVDAKGRIIDLATGCSADGAYSTILQLNHWVSGTGQKLGTVMRDAKGVARGKVGSTWSINRLPANATHVWIETYVRHYTGSPCGMSCAGAPSTAKYGWTNRRLVSLASLNTAVRLIAPTKTAYGGQTGAIQATLVNSAGRAVNYPLCGSGAPKSCVRVYAWSMNTPEGSRVQGWGIGTKISTTSWRVSALASGQPYRVRVQQFSSTGAQRDFEAFVRVYKGVTSKTKIKVG